MMAYVTPRSERRLVISNGFESVMTVARWPQLAEVAIPMLERDFLCVSLDCDGGTLLRPQDSIREPVKPHFVMQ